MPAPFAIIIKSSALQFFAMMLLLGGRTGERERGREVSYHYVGLEYLREIKEKQKIVFAFTSDQYDEDAQNIVCF